MDNSEQRTTMIKFEEIDRMNNDSRKSSVLCRDVKGVRLNEKCTFTCTCAVIVLLSQGMVSFPWLIPYIYALLTPVLVTIRIVMYWRKRWHYFLLDFCYYANMFCLIFLCFPSNGIIFSIMFSLSLGPLIWAIPIYRNSLVLHSIDKVTSTYIHILPPILSFVARWYPKEVSIYWYTEFLPEMPELSALWIYIIPFAAFVIHSLIYSLVVNVLNSSSKEVSSYNYLGEKEDSFLYKLFNCVGKRYRCGMFYVWNWIFCALTLCGSVLCYYSFTINWICILFLSLTAIWNGASYYVHVFAVRGFVEEIE
ncbi:uncharacterized protein LOC132749860 isoform X1 [Ruditapes philippinarum]|uniref:uncharacterized protein LOC132749860 isoform X1 n=1 Tax=Ruditapes philippinarum TaxID=129788 RepID=UPI00295C326A|nr:uncharacterized protein LOC132749860 isoform X1 [Ruditapes philippinarum]